MKGDTHMFTRPLECNYLMDKGCLLPTAQQDLDDGTIKAREKNWVNLKRDIDEQVQPGSIFVLTLRSLLSLERRFTTVSIQDCMPRLDVALQAFFQTS